MTDPKEPPDRGKGKKPDFADKINPDNITRLVPPKPKQPKEKWQQNFLRPDFNLSDRNLAQCVYDRHANDFRYSVDRRCWLYYSGKLWEEDSEGIRLMRAISDLLAHEDFRKVARKPKDILHLGSAACCSSVTKFLREMFACNNKVFDSDLMLLNCPGGTYDARTGQMRPHRWSDFITKVTLADPSPGCPLWLRHVEFVTCGDKEFARYLQALAGYALFGAGKQQVIIFIYGDTNNGKSTFLRAMANAMGSGQEDGYGLSDFPAEHLMVTHNTPHREMLMRLMGRRFAISTEVPDDARWNPIYLKKLSGNEEITANKMYQNSTSFLWSGVLALAGNSAPSFKNIDESIRRRLHVIPFDAHVAAEDRDTEIDVKLKEEAGGILNWMIEGWEIFKTQELKKPSAVEKATEEYVASQDHVRDWIDECCQVNIGFTVLTTFAELHQSFVKYAENNKLPIISKHRLKEAMKPMEFGPPNARFNLQEAKSDKVRGWRRIILKQTYGNGY